MDPQDQIWQAILTALLLVIAYFVREVLAKVKEMDITLQKVKERLVRIETEIDVRSDVPS